MVFLIYSYFVIGLLTSIYMMFFHPISKYSDRFMATFIGGVIFGWWLWPVFLPLCIRAHKKILSSPESYGAHRCGECGALATFESADKTSFRCKLHI